MLNLVVFLDTFICVKVMLIVQFLQHISLNSTLYTIYNLSIESALRQNEAVHSV